jgi:membrane protease YdiL (CAAX protease family)
MLSAKPWKADAIVRLLISVFVCMYAGSLAVTIGNSLQRPGRGSPWFFVLAGSALICLLLTLILVNQPWKLETFVRRSVRLLICFYAGLLLGMWAQKLAGPSGPSTLQMVVAALTFQGAALIFTWRLLREHRSTWAEAFGFSNRWVHALLFGVIIACIFLPVGNALQWASYRVMENYLSAKPQEQEAVQTLRVAVSWVERATLGGVTILVAPVAEEVLFRGIIYPWIKQAGFPRLALWITSIVFAAIHSNLMIFLPLLLLALALTVLYEKTNNLLAPIIAHALFNGMNFAVLYLTESG